MQFVWFLMWLWLAGWAGSAAAAQAPELHTDSAEASAGYYRLTWDWPDAANHRFELQEGDGSDFAERRTLYIGPDRATVLSGRADGEFYYRVRLHPEGGQAGPWSETVAVKVEHHSLTRAFWFFGIGAVVFLATLALVVGGNRKAPTQEHP